MRTTTATSEVALVVKELFVFLKDIYIYPQVICTLELSPADHPESGWKDAVLIEPIKQDGGAPSVILKFCQIQK